jgi:hypothetical protein
MFAHEMSLPHFDTSSVRLALPPGQAPCWSDLDRAEFITASIHLEVRHG